MRYESHERDPEFIPIESIEIKVLVQYLWQYFCLSHSWLPPKATCKADNYLATDEDRLCVPNTYFHFALAVPAFMCYIKFIKVGCCCKLLIKGVSFAVIVYNMQKNGRGGETE